MLGPYLEFRPPGYLFFMPLHISCMSYILSLYSIHGEIFSQSGEIKPKLYCNCTFPIVMAPNRIPFGFKSIGNVTI